MDNLSHWVTFLNYIFNPMAGFIHILPKIGLKQPSIFFRVLHLGGAVFFMHSKKCWVVLTHVWVKYDNNNSLHYNLLNHNMDERNVV